MESTGPHKAVLDIARYLTWAKLVSGVGAAKCPLWPDDTDLNTLIKHTWKEAAMLVSAETGSKDWPRGVKGLPTEWEARQVSCFGFLINICSVADVSLIIDIRQYACSDGLRHGSCSVCG
jgi:hypothetical protein